MRSPAASLAPGTCVNYFASRVRSIQSTSVLWPSFQAFEEGKAIAKCHRHAVRCPFFVMPRSVAGRKFSLAADADSGLAQGESESLVGAACSEPAAAALLYQREVGCSWMLQVRSWQHRLSHVELLHRDS